MKLSWKDMISALIVLAGGAIVYAKYYNYNWAVVGSWRSAALVLALGGVLLFALSSFDFTNRSILNVTEMILGTAAIVLAVWGVIVASQAVFYSLAIVLGVTWLIDVARHARHSWIGNEGMGTTTFHHHAPVH